MEFFSIFFCFFLGELANHNSVVYYFPTTAFSNITIFIFAHNNPQAFMMKHNKENIVFKVTSLKRSQARQLVLN